MSDDESRHEHLPTEGGQIFAENGSETMENDQTGLPSWAAALTAQLQPAFAERLAAQDAAHRAERGTRDCNNWSIFFTVSCLIMEFI